MRKLCLLFALFTACATESEPEPTQKSFTVTVVEVGPDGAKEISRTPITAAERAAMDVSRPPARADVQAGTGQVTQALDTGSPCALATVFLYDDFNFQGDVLCVRGAGYVHLSQFVHHWNLQTDFFGSHWIPVGWQGQAGSAWTTFFSAQFRQDPPFDHVTTVGPQSGVNFFEPIGGIISYYPPDSVVIY